MASSIGKLLATLATYPILTVRVKLQASTDASESYIVALINLVKKLKVSEFYRGVQAKLIQTILANAFLMVTYEKMREFIKVMILQHYARKLAKSA